MAKLQSDKDMMDQITRSMLHEVQNTQKDLFWGFFCGRVQILFFHLRKKPPCFRGLVEARERGRSWMKGDFGSCRQLCWSPVPPILSEVKSTVRLSRTDPDLWRPGPARPPSVTAALTYTQLNGKGTFCSVLCVSVFHVILKDISGRSLAYHDGRGGQDHLHTSCEAAWPFSVLDNVSVTAYFYRLWSVCQVTYEPPCCALPQAVPKTTNTHFICTKTHTHSVIMRMKRSKCRLGKKKRLYGDMVLQQKSLSLIILNSFH